MVNSNQAKLGRAELRESYFAGSLLHDTLLEEAIIENTLFEEVSLTERVGL